MTRHNAGLLLNQAGVMKVSSPPQVLQWPVDEDPQDVFMLTAIWNFYE